MFKFDTGAQNTVLSINKLNQDLNDKQVEVIASTVKTRYVHQFRAANGTVMSGVLCSVKNVIVDTVLIPKFYFYLILDASNVALLGYDFISGCSFTHERGSNILIKTVDITWQEDIIKKQGERDLEIDSLIVNNV